MSRDDIPADVWEDYVDERRRQSRLRHWCSECQGHRGGPCDFGDEPEQDNETEDDDE